MRPSRLIELVVPHEVALPTPPAEPGHPARGSLVRVLATSLLPAVLPAVGLAAIIAATGQSGAIVLTSVALAGSFGIAMVITTLLTRRDEDAREREASARYAQARIAYEAAVGEIQAECHAHFERERRVLAETYPPPQVIEARARTVAPELWQRRRGDADFLDLRFGIGPLAGCVRLKSDREIGADAFARNLLTRYTTQREAPITHTLAPGTRAAIVGDSTQVTAMVGWVLLQLAVLHGPDDVTVTVLSRDETLCSWAKWLPHTRLNQGTSAECLVARTGTEASSALRAVGEQIASRGADNDGQVHVVICDQRDWESLEGRVARYLPEQHPSLCTIVTGSSLRAIAGDCAWVVELGDTHGTLRRRIATEAPQTFLTDAFAADEGSVAALALADVTLPVSQLRHPVPRTARTADILGEDARTAEGVERAWTQARAAFRLSTPIGIGPNGATVDLDLRRDGPHALIAGTTGSGKSEFLLSLVVSLSARIPPDLLNFVLVDYKGGSAFSDVAALPHVVGVVTDLDARLAARAITSLRAELQLRERILAESSPPATNIIEYQSVPRPRPLANLVIIIDEFHRLVAEQPDFIEEMVRIAQQGRSLGVHLLLATQKPSGVVTDQIRANTALRICLRVTDEADSRDVLGAADAAFIPRDVPGRAYMRVGNESAIEFQTGRVSGSVAVRDRDQTVIRAALFLPPETPTVHRRGSIAAVLSAPPDAGARDDDGAATAPLVDERLLILSAIAEATQALRIPVQASPWLPPLPALVPSEAFPPALRSRGVLNVPLGLVDEPEVQRQHAFDVDLAAGHILIAGDANSGKTTALLAIADAAMSAGGADRVHMYALDFAGGGLSSLEHVPHSGGVAAQHEPEKVEWLLQALKDIVADRLERRDATSTLPFAQILVLVDNFVAFWQAVQDNDGGMSAADDLFEVMDIGRAVGVTFAITVERPDAVRASIMSLMTTRVALTMRDVEGYTALGMARPPRADVVTPGRGLLAGARANEVQFTLPRLVAPDQYPDPTLGGPLRIRPLPAAVPYAEVLKDAPNGALVLGAREGTRPQFVFPEDQHLVVLGPRRSGKSTALAVGLAELRRLKLAKAFVLNTRRSPVLQSVANDPTYASTTSYAERAPDIDAAWDAIIDEARRRVELYAAGEEAGLGRWAIVIDDSDVLDIPSSAADVLQQLVLRGTDMGATIVFAADTHALRSTYPAGVTRALLNARTGVLLAPSAPEDFDFFGVRGRPSRLPAGRGYFCSTGEKHMIQIATFS